MITTHVLDLARGVPGAGIGVTLEMQHGDRWTVVNRGTTDRDGRLSSLTEGKTLTPGVYRLTFATTTYHRHHGIAEPFFEDAQVTFHLRDGSHHVHVPLLLSPYGYSTYRGS